MEFLTTLKDIILITGSLTTIVLAFYGLNKWKKEYKGKVKYVLAQKTLKIIYTLRDRFKGVRSNFIFAHEFPKGYDPRDDDPIEGEKYVFENRLNPLNETYNELLSLLPEIEVEFGKKVRDKCGDILNKVAMYKMRLDDYFLLKDTGQDSSNHFNESRKVVYSTVKEDKISMEFEAVVTTAELAINKNVK